MHGCTCVYVCNTIQIIQFCSTTLDHEIDWMYDFTVTATDNGPIPRHSMPASHVIINVTDANEGDD